MEDTQNTTVKNFFHTSKAVVELYLSTSYISEEVWLVGIGRKRSFLFLRGSKVDMYV